MKILLALLCLTIGITSFAAPQPHVNSDASKLTSVVLSGNNSLSYADLKFIFDPYLGKALSPQDQIAIITKINEHYKREGYIFSVSVKYNYVDSILRISILEGSVRDVVLYDKLRDNKLLQKYVDALRALKPFNTKKLARTLGLIARIPGIQGKEIVLIPRLVNSDNLEIIKSSEVVDIILMPDGYDSVQAFFSFSNKHKFDYKNIEIYRQEDSTGHNITADTYLTINNPFKIGDRFSTYLSSTWNKRSNTLYSLYAVPINTLGTSIKANVMHSSSRVRGSFKTNSAGLGLSHPLILNRHHSLDVGSEMVFFSSKEMAIATNKPDTKHNKFNALKGILNVIYKAQDLLFSNHSYQLALHKSLTNKENNIKKSFSKLVLIGKSTVPILKDLLKFSLYTNGQLNTSNHISEQELFAVGEFRGGRGFKAAEIYGEKGFSLAAELSLSNYFKDFILSKCESYIYLDSGWTKYAKTNQKNAITSTGIGTHLSLLNSGAILTFEVSKPLRNTSKSLFKTSNRVKFFTGFEYYFRY